MTKVPTLVIVGASLAGAKAAEGARDAGYDGRIVLVGDEPHLPYERPPLSKAVLRGEAEPDSARVHPIGYYGEHEIELVADEVTGIDPAGRRVRLAGGGQIPFDSLVLATGAAPRRLDVPGADLDGVHYLRTLDDSLALRRGDPRHGPRRRHRSGVDRLGGCGLCSADGRRRRARRSRAGAPTACGR